MKSCSFFLVFTLKRSCEVHHWSASYIRVSPKGHFAAKTYTRVYTVKIKANIGQFCGLLEIIVADWIW